jgi:hypothetical protein
LKENKKGVFDCEPGMVLRQIWSGRRKDLEVFEKRNEILASNSE